MIHDNIIWYIISLWPNVSSTYQEKLMLEVGRVEVEFTTASLTSDDTQSIFSLLRIFHNWYVFFRVSLDAGSFATIRIIWILCLPALVTVTPWMNHSGCHVDLQIPKMRIKTLDWKEFRGLEHQARTDAFQIFSIENRTIELGLLPLRIWALAPQDKVLKLYFTVALVSFCIV